MDESLFRCVVFHFFFFFAFQLLLLRVGGSSSLCSCFFSLLVFLRLLRALLLLFLLRAFSFDLSIVFTCILPIGIVFFNDYCLNDCYLNDGTMIGLFSVKNTVLCEKTHTDWQSVWTIRISNLYDNPYEPYGSIIHINHTDQQSIYVFF